MYIKAMLICIILFIPPLLFFTFGNLFDFAWLLDRMGILGYIDKQWIYIHNACLCHNRQANSVLEYLRSCKPRVSLARLS